MCNLSFNPLYRHFNWKHFCLTRNSLCRWLWTHREPPASAAGCWDQRHAPPHSAETRFSPRAYIFIFVEASFTSSFMNHALISSWRGLRLVLNPNDLPLFSKSFINLHFKCKLIVCFYLTYIIFWTSTGIFFSISSTLTSFIEKKKQYFPLLNYSYSMAKTKLGIFWGRSPALSYWSLCPFLC